MMYPHDATIEASKKGCACENTKQVSRPRVLLSAYSCNPYQGSEPGVGWNRAVLAARDFDTWVLCGETPHGPDIRRYIRENGPIPGLHFISIEKNWIAKACRRVPGLYYLSYRMWQWQAYRVAVELSRRVRFDIIHQATFCTYREPGYLWRMSVSSDGPGYVWGPLGGTQCFPPSMLALIDRRGAFRERIRSWLNRIHLRLAKRPRKVAKVADVTLAANTTVKRDLDRMLRCDTRVLLETGLHKTSSDYIHSVSTANSDDEILRVLWCGALEPWKALQLLLLAVARVPRHVSLEVRIIGSGSLKKRCQELAKTIGIGDRVSWLGQISYNEMPLQYKWADLFVFTSMRDTSGNVMLEALNAGLPVIAVDHQGAHDIITDRCGIKIPVRTPDQCVSQVAHAIEALALDPIRRRLLSEGALERASCYSWERQAEQMKQFYLRAIEAKRLRAKTSRFLSRRKSANN